MTKPFDNGEFNSQDTHTMECSNTRGNSTSVELLEAIRLVAHESAKAINPPEQTQKRVRKNSEIVRKFN